MGGPRSSDAGVSIAVDVNENVYVTSGFFRATANFNPSGTAINITSAGGSIDIFVAKLDASGNVQWAGGMGGTQNEQSYSIAVDGSGNVYTTGYFAGTADFDPSNVTFPLTAPSPFPGFTFPWDIFISKLSTNGAFVFAKQMGGTGYDWGYSITVDANNNIFSTGSFQGTSRQDFDPGSGKSTLVAAGGGNDFDIFVSKLDATGAYVWAKRMGGSGYDVGNSVALDVSGNVLTTGSFNATANFNPGGTNNLTSAGKYDIFVSKLNSSGAYVWANAMGGTDSDAGTSISIDASK